VSKSTSEYQDRSNRDRNKYLTTFSVFYRYICEKTVPHKSDSIELTENVRIENIFILAQVNM
jgi:hypothetical protein